MVQMESDKVYVQLTPHRKKITEISAGLRLGAIGYDSTVITQMIGAYNGGF
jgi:hypothetical protein